MKQEFRLRIGPIVVIAVGAGLIIAALILAPIALQLMRPAAASMPPALAGMPIQAAAYAQEAIDIIDEMHAKAFPLSAGAVGWYGSFGEAVLYISGAPTVWLARSLTDDMTTRIAANESPFTPLGEETIDGTQVYSLQGQGQMHFYFRAGNLLVWLAADEWMALQALEDSLRFYAGDSVGD